VAVLEQPKWSVVNVQRDCIVVAAVDLNKCGEGELDVSIVSSSGDPVCSEVRLIEAGRLEVVYSPEEAGMHFAEVMFNSEPVNGEIYEFVVQFGLVCDLLVTPFDGAIF